MSKPTSRALRALRDLAIAMSNATLILVAICLFLGLRLATSVNDFAGNVAENLVSAEPLREDVRAMTDEIAALRADLAGLGAAAGDAGSGVTEQVAERIEALDGRLQTVQTRVQGVQDRLNGVEMDPGAVLDHAISTAAIEFSDALGARAGCRPTAGDADLSTQDASN